MAHTFEQATQAIVNYLTKGNAAISIPDHVDLFEAKHLDSLQFMGFIMVLEEVIGAEIDIAELDVTDFSTLGRIKVKFLSHLEGCEIA